MSTARPTRIRGAENASRARARLALWLAGLALAAAWVHFAIAPSTLAWGLGSFRYLSGDAARWLALLAALSLLPLTARALLPAASWIGARAWCWAALAGCLVFVRPDRLHLAAGGAPPDTLGGRLLGAGAAALFAWLATGFVRSLGHADAAAFAAAATLVCGGTLGMFGGAPRGTMALVLAVAVGAWLAARSLRAGHADRAGVALAGASLAALAPIWLTRDGGGPGPLTAFRLADLVNVAFVLAPLAPLAFMVAPLRRRALGRDRRLLGLAALALPFVAVAVCVHPAAGALHALHRFAPAACAAAFAAAALVGDALRGSGGRRWAAVSVAGVALVGTIAWLEVQSDGVRGEAWIAERNAAESTRPAAERAADWTFLGERAASQDRWGEAAQAWRRAAELRPEAATLTRLGMATTLTGSLEEACSLYRRALALDPRQELAWRGLAAAAFQLGDRSEARRAVVALREMKADAPELRRLVDALAGPERKAAESAVGLARADRGGPFLVGGS